MTTADRIKATADYFGLTLSKFDEEKLTKIWHVEPVVIEKKVFKVIQKESPILKMAYFPAKLITLQHKFEFICGLYDADPVKCLQKNRAEKYIKAKAHFVRLVKTSGLKISERQLGYFLRYKDHSTVNWLLHHSTIDVPIPPIPETDRAKKYKETHTKNKAA